MLIYFQKKRTRNLINLLLTSCNNEYTNDNISKKYFLELEQNIPHIQQTLFDLQNEYYKLWKDNFMSQLLLQKEFFNKSELDNFIPKNFKEIFENMSDETIKFRSIIHKMTITNIEQGKNYAKTLNDNSNTFIEINRKFLENWISILKINQKY